MLTFKQYLLEDADLSRYLKLSPEEIAQLPEMNASNLDDTFKVGTVAFSQTRGLGAVPWNQEVNYKGFVAMMKPADFLKFALTMEREPDRVNRTVDWFKQGYATGSPWLQVDFSNPEEYHVVGHEGRARTKALSVLQPNVLVPVHVFVYMGKAKDITPEIISNLNTHIMAERVRVPIQNKIQSIWLQGKHINL